MLRMLVCSRGRGRALQPFLSERRRLSADVISASESVYTENPLVDLFGRRHNYLRMSLTEKCNLRCKYCMPQEGVTLTLSEELLTLQERKQVISLFASLGVDKLRFTGGEPTISKDLLPLVEHAKSAHGDAIKSIGLTSNGLILSGQLRALQRAGLSSVNVSLDTMRTARFAEISRREGKLLNRVLASIFTAQSLDLPVKVNCVVARGMNDDEMGDFVSFAAEHDVTIRFIELMPFDGNKWNPVTFISYYEMMDRIEKEKGLKLERMPTEDKNDTTKWYTIQGNPRGRVGFISSMSSHFCGGCNRLRITADGRMKVCLFGEEELSLRDEMRAGFSNGQIIEKLSKAVRRKKAALGGNVDAIQIAASHNRPMILIGG